MSFGILTVSIMKIGELAITYGLSARTMPIWEYSPNPRLRQAATVARQVRKGSRVWLPSGDLHFGMSRVDGMNKWTEGIRHGVVSVVTGRNRNQSRISLLTHVGLSAIEGEGGPFEILYRDQLRDSFTEASALVVGGLEPKSGLRNDLVNIWRNDGYFHAVSRLASIHTEMLGIRTSVFPRKMETGVTQVYLDNEGSQLVVYHAGLRGFTPSIADFVPPVRELNGTWFDRLKLMPNYFYTEDSRLNL